MSLRGRAIWVGLVTLLMTWFAVPSFFSEEERLANPFLPNQGINLGLDLQGGIHWLLRIDTEKAIRQEMENIERQLRRDLEDREIAGVELSLLEGNELEVSGEIETVRERFERDYPTVDVLEHEGTLLVSLTDQWKRDVVGRGVRQALEVLRKRVDGLGVREPVIAPQGEGRILVQMPGEIDPRRARSILEETTFLEFKLVVDQAPNEELLRAKYSDGLPEQNEIVVARNDDGSVSVAYLVPSSPVLTGAMLEDARLGYDRRNRPLVLFTWNSEGTRIFREFTSENIGRQLAAIIDGEVVTAPVIRSRIGQRGQIEGQFTVQEAADLAIALRSGALPIPLVIEEERSVGPALGADSIRKGLRSIMLGGVMVVLFMGIYYRTAGGLADLTMIINLIFILGLMGMAQATLTLPGLAGLVLTVGMAVDANVIIFERIREELQAGKSARSAIQAGFNRSRLTILDANITTMIAAVVLLYYGRGPVQGFGVTLAIGIVSSVFGALIVTRLLVDLVLARNPKALRI
ncbi:MAG: protein translocase subunit SecD [Myxococcota bacterium]